MDTKDLVLDILKQNIGKPVSGEDIARRLSVSRNAVWKAVRRLKADGVAIGATTNRGYVLDPGADVVTAAGVEANMRVPAHVQTFRSLTSTNSYLKQLAEQGAPDGTVIVAEEQTGGRGRRGRGFFAPAGSGIYFSLLLRPRFSAQQSLILTAAAAVAVADAIEVLCGKNTGIKWVNDVYVDGRKVCGILTEAAADVESGGLAYIVVGIGVNVYEPNGGFPVGLSDIAGSVCGREKRQGLRERMIARIADELFRLYRALPSKDFLDRYREKSTVIGKSVTVFSGNEKYNATVTGIDDSAALEIVTADGGTRKLSSGEITIRMMENE